MAAREPSALNTFKDDMYYLLEKIDHFGHNGCKCLVIASTEQEAFNKAKEIFDLEDETRYQLTITEMSFNEEGIMWL